jgi:hypothetical protein
MGTEDMRALSPLIYAHMGFEAQQNRKPVQKISSLIHRCCKIFCFATKPELPVELQELRL